MDIGVPTRPLGNVEIGALLDCLLAQPEELWFADYALRQRVAPRQDTHAIYMLFAQGWPTVQVARFAGWEPLHEAAEPIIVRVLESYPDGGRVVKAIFARLPPGAAIQPHKDAGELLMNSHRIHVPLVTNPGVEFRVDGSVLAVREGEAFELNNALPHAVYNHGTEARIHFIIDYLPPIPG